MGAAADQQPDLVSSKNDLLKKHVATLAIVPETLRISLNARRAFNVLLNVAQSQPRPADGKFRTSAAEFKRLADIGQADNTELKSALKELMRTLVTWQSPTDSENAAMTWSASTLLAGARIIDRQGRTSIIEWSYSAQIIDEILDPNVFAVARLSVLSSFKTHSAMALFEICSRYAAVGRTPKHSWLWWRPVLTGNSKIPAKAEYRYFKRDVLTPALAEVNSANDSEIEVSLIENKGADRRVVDSIQFDISKKKVVGGKKRGGGREPMPLSADEIQVVGQAVREGVRQHKAEDMVEQFGAKVLADGLTVLKKRKAISSGSIEPVRSLDGYLQAILPGIEEEARDAEHVDKKGATRVQSDAAPRRAQHWRDAWIARAKKSMHSEIEAMPHEVLLEWISRFRADLVERRPSLVRMFDTHGDAAWAKPLFVNDFISFYAKETGRANWRTPTADQLLEIAVEIGEPAEKES